MQSPIQLVALLRPSTRPMLLAATAVSSTVFTATPFLLTPISSGFDVGVGTASLVSTAQLGGFVLSSSLARLRLRANDRTLFQALVAAALVNVASAFVASFPLLLLLRFGSGLGLGIISWIAWAEVFGQDDRMGDIAVVGPVVGIVAAPLAGALVEWRGDTAVFLALAVLALAPLLIRGGSDGEQTEIPVDDGPRSRPIPVALLILVCLWLLTLSGSAVFVFAVVIGNDLGLSPLGVSLAFSANAALGIPSARWRGGRPFAGLWLAGTGLAAFAMTNIDSSVVFFTAVGLWGFCFWAGVPGIFTLLAQRSANPADRAGDAQAAMAFGRVIGPAVGGLMIEAGSLRILGWCTGATILLAASTLIYIERRTEPINNN